jgi:hypothetical protein
VKFLCSVIAILVLSSSITARAESDVSRAPTGDALHSVSSTDVIGTKCQQHPFLPISVLMKGSVTMPEHRIQHTHTAIMTHVGNNIVEEDDAISVNGGSALVYAHKPTVIHFAKGDVNLGPDSIVSIMSVAHSIQSAENNSSSADLIVVRNMHDSHKGSVYVSSKNSVLPVHAGEEMVIGGDESTVKDALSRCPIGRRHVRIGRVDEIGLVAISEISPSHTLKYDENFRHLSGSNEAQHKIVVGKIMKTAAGILIVGVPHGPYHRYCLSSKPEPVMPLSGKALRDLYTSKHPARGGFRGM